MPTNSPTKKEGRVWVQLSELDPFRLASCSGLTGLNNPRGEATFLREPGSGNRARQLRRGRSRRRATGHDVQSGQ